MAIRKSLVFLLVLFSGLIYTSQAYNFAVGGRAGWVLSPSENYNHWAGRMRFQVNDTLYFKYEKGMDSVLLVSQDDYYSCNTANPILRLDGGDSIFKFDRSGPFFFISGNNGSCDKGQKLIVVVMAVRNKPTTPPPATVPAPATQPPATSPLSPSSPPALSPTTPSPSPVTGTPVPSPAPAPVTYPATPSPSPSPLSPELSPSPAITPSPEYSPVGSPVPGSGTETPPPTPALVTPSPSPPADTPATPGTTPADTPATPGTTPASIRAPPPGRSASSSITPSMVVLLTFTFVLSVTLGTI